MQAQSASNVTVESKVVANPVLRGMMPDPTCLWDQDRESIVVVNSSFEQVPGLPITESPDLLTWTHAGFAVDADMGNKLFLDCARDSGGLFAPTMRKKDGRYIIACTVKNVDCDLALRQGHSPQAILAYKRSGGNFIITADSLSGPWNGPFWIEGAVGIDPDIYIDSDGVMYWTQTTPAERPKWSGQTAIWTQRISSDSWELQGERTVIWHGASTEAFWPEGPHLYRYGDYIYLFTAEGGTYLHHSEMVARAYAPRSLDEALQSSRVSRLCQNCYESRLFRPSPNNPLLTHRNMGLSFPVQCVGHADIACHPRYGWLLFCLGVRRYADADGRNPRTYLGRETFVTTLQWQQQIPEETDIMDRCFSGTKDPGWPVASPGIGRLPLALRIQDESSRVSLMDTAECLYPQIGQPQMPPISIAGDRSNGTFRRITDLPMWMWLSDSFETVIHLSRSNYISFDVSSRPAGGCDVIVHMMIDSCIHESIVAVEKCNVENMAIVFRGATTEIVIADTDAAQLKQNLRPQYVLPARYTTAHVFDTGYLSVESTSGFVGCLAGVRMLGADEILQEERQVAHMKAE
ncbi:family 43 glycosylhydrolase [Bifidobacterium olomucense]|uniref:Alpha-L-arabinofuranosidase n=1 Tax=Bifidobacterium olomucense TaxID=2675324 RepID=A0A7Y0HXI8_9BIFI|nr:family 43 glycosylhydrolase [Bifidobacterium sp. DSM 109959]NMM98059.1 alpha-L-arabinofuranosidase [Bifidobacterium sp. DSM 109959]